MDGARTARSETRSQRNKERGIKPGRSRHKVWLNVAEFDAYFAALDLTSNAAVAEHLDVGEGSVFRARTGRHPIGDGFIAALTKTLPDTVDLRRFIRTEDAA